MNKYLIIGLGVAPREVNTIKICNYPSYNKVTTSNEGDWKQIYLKECIEED